MAARRATFWMGWWVAAGVMGVLSLGDSARAEDAHPLTMAEARALVDAGKYRDALMPLQRMLDLKGKAAENYDRHGILMLRAECQLQIKEWLAALETLELARKEAFEKSDQAGVVEAMSLSFLIQKSPGFSYTPRSGAVRKPVPILDHTLRKAAYAALFADEFGPLETKAKEAVKQAVLSPSLEAVKNILAIEGVEEASGSQDGKTKKIVESLTFHSLTLMQGDLNAMEKRRQTISDLANQVVTEERTVYYPDGTSDTEDWTHKVGLAKGDVQTLAGIEDDCAKLPGAASELALALGGDLKQLKIVATSAEKLGELAKKTRTDKY